MRIVAGLFKGQILQAPKGEATRPTSSQLREALFNICRHEIEGADFLDLFCGSGAIGLEALSRGARSACFVDRHPLAIHALKANLEKLDLSAKIIKADALAALSRLEKEAARFSLIYVDPPYQAEPKKPASKNSEASKILSFIDNSSLLAPGGLLFIEEGGNFEREQPLTTLTEEPSRSFGKSVLFKFRR